MVTTDDTTELPENLDPLITEVVSGPPDTFVARRDALVRELKSAGRTDESAAVKRLRKPSRLAWALDAAVAADGDAIERVAAAVQTVVEAQEGAGDMRSATRDLRDTVAAAATVAAKVAKDAGMSVARADLVPALMAVVGDAEAFDRLRKGQLSEIPAASGFDAPAPLTTAPRISGETGAAATTERPPDTAAVERARAAVDEAEEAASTAHDQVEAAERAVDVATAELEAAEQALHEAEVAAREASDRLRFAKREAKAARDTARETERAASIARGKLQRLQE